MLEKPVIIMGGGLWGALLALRLQQRLPQVKFRLYESSSTLGDGQSLAFHRSDVTTESLKWLKPFITNQWGRFQVQFPRFEKTFDDGYCSIHSLEFHDALQGILDSSNIFLNTDITLEEALSEGAFVIDTRNNGYFKAQGYQKSLALLVRTKGCHHVSVPVTVDATVEQRLGFRYLQYLPIDESTLLVKDVRYSTNPALYDEYFEEDILSDLRLRGLEVREVLNRERDFRKVPLDEFMPETAGRVIRLEGFAHDATGEVLPDAVRLIEKMISTSFRYGELKEVLREYQEERRSKKRLLRTMNRLFFRNGPACDGRYQFMQLLYQLPAPVREKFYAGDLELRDVGKAFFGRPIVPLFRMASQLIPLPLRS